MLPVSGFVPSSGHEEQLDQRRKLPSCLYNKDNFERVFQICWSASGSVDCTFTKFMTVEIRNALNLASR